MSTAIDHQAIADARTAEYLARSPRARQRAIADFVLQTARVSQDLARMLDMAETHGSTPELDQAIELAEAMVRGRYRELFGREMR